jgi:hypothetical protein
MRAIVVAGLVVGLVAAPAASAPIPTGFLRITVDEGCLARVVKGPYKKVVSGRTELPTGRYRIQVKPATCTAKPRTFRVREGRTVRARVSAETLPAVP